MAFWYGQEPIAPATLLHASRPMPVSSLAFYAGLIAILVCAALVAQKIRETKRRVRRERFLHKFDETRAAHEAERLWRHQHPEIMEEKDDEE